MQNLWLNWDLEAWLLIKRYCIYFYLASAAKQMPQVQLIAMKQLHFSWMQVLSTEQTHLSTMSQRYSPIPCPNIWRSWMTVIQILQRCKNLPRSMHWTPCPARVVFWTTKLWKANTRWSSIGSGVDQPKNVDIGGRCPIHWPLHPMDGWLWLASWRQWLFARNGTMGHFWKFAAAWHAAFCGDSPQPKSTEMRLYRGWLGAKLLGTLPDVVVLGKLFMSASFPNSNASHFILKSARISPKIPFKGLQRASPCFSLRRATMEICSGPGQLCNLPMGKHTLSTCGLDSSEWWRMQPGHSMPNLQLARGLWCLLGNHSWSLSGGS